MAYYSDESDILMVVEMSLSVSIQNRVNCWEDEGQAPLAVDLGLPDGADLSGQHLKSRNDLQIVICCHGPGLCDDRDRFDLQNVDRSQELYNALS